MDKFVIIAFLIKSPRKKLLIDKKIKFIAIRVKFIEIFKKGTKKHSRN